MPQTTSKTDLMRAIRDELLNAKDAPLFTYRTENNYHPVIGEGNHDADIMFIGEAPGKNEALTGRPFCGASGRILDELLTHIGVDRGDVYITNIVKDRPPGNRDPIAAEIDYYTPLLDRQIDIIEPKVIATLGRYAMTYIMTHFDLEFEILPISQNHGNIFDAETSYGSVKIVPLYHPAVAVYNANSKDELKKDMETLLTLV